MFSRVGDMVKHPGVNKLRKIIFLIEDKHNFK